MASLDEHLRELLKLPLEDRAYAARRLFESLEDDEADPDAETAWAAEIERRLAKHDAGQATLVTMDEAVERIRRAARR
jgi:putative addiction module component (TIGR02574 family)